MEKLEAILWELYSRDDPRVSLLSSFQSFPYTHIKIVVNDGKHDIVVEEIADHMYTFHNHKDEALADTIKSALKKVANLIIEHACASIITELVAEFSRDLV